MPSVAVIDVGSNSIKVLLAARGPDGRPVASMMRTVETRISAGISQARPRLAEEGMKAGIEAIRSLLADVAPYGPDRVVLVATSAVRGAANGADFQKRVLDATSQPVRILSGDEEAALIGRGLLCDPQLAHLEDFQVFDLGGGSLECLSFAGRGVVRAASLPLGCVRLTEKLVADPAKPLSRETAAAIAAHVRDAMASAGLSFASPSEAVATGGTMTAVLKVLAERADPPAEAGGSRVTAAQLKELLQRIGSLPLSERRKVPGLAPERADVFPAALATFVAIAEIGGFDAFQHSVYNLRWGVAAEALDFL
jgi:exopolyphosphatase/guanosine-5'-triphosphate,3'-diphosphate pyrophosphatase